MRCLLLPFLPVRARVGVRERGRERERRGPRSDGAGGCGVGCAGSRDWIGWKTHGLCAAFSGGPFPKRHSCAVELPAWETYFFMCPYGPAKLWNVKKYVFQVRNSLTGGRGQRVPVGSPGGQTGRQLWLGRASVASCLGVGGQPVPCRYCSVTLPVSAGGSVRQTLNIQRADCSRGDVARGRRGVPGGRAGAGGQGSGALGITCCHLEGSFARRKGCLCDGGRKLLRGQAK